MLGDILHQVSKEGLITSLYQAIFSPSSNLLGPKHGIGSITHHGSRSSGTSSLTSSVLSFASSLGFFRSIMMSLSFLAAYNIRWRYFIPFLLTNEKPLKLPYRKVEAAECEDNARKSIVVVLLHGMWNDASYFREWQEYLAEGGYTSYAIELLPGERWLPGGLLRQELVRDLEYTLRDIPVPYVLMGHSRGGLVLQGALQCSSRIRKNTSSAGVILLASYPLGYIPPLRSLWDQRKDGVFHSWMGVLNILLFGKLRSKEYTKRIFLLPTSNERSSKVARYLRESVQAPSDGALYCCWHPSPSPMPDIPALIMGAEHDVLVPPLLVKDVFLERFPNSSHLIIPHQAHAFRDGGWQLSMVEPLIDWLDSRNAAVIKEVDRSKKEEDLANEQGDWSRRVLDERKQFDEL